MTNRISKGLREKRFAVKSPAKVDLLVELQTGDRITCRVENASLSGLAVVLEAEQIRQIEIPVVGTIIPESKIIWGDDSVPLGRLILRRIIHEADSSKLAFSCIDTKVPLLGPLSALFTELAIGKESPLEFELGAKKFSLASFQETQFSHPDLFEKCRQFAHLHADLRKNPLYQYYSVKQADSGSRAIYKLSGKKRRVDSLSFASYDYLGHSRRPEVIEAAIRAIEKFGTSAKGSAILGGRTTLHEELESRIARFFGHEDAILFGAGFATNVGGIAGLVWPNDLIVADVYSHASLFDGMKASEAKRRLFSHNNMVGLRKVLDEHRSADNGCLLITEGLFSMEGTVPDIAEFVKIAKEYNARTFVDEAHSLGVLGETGRGAAERCEVLDEVDVCMGTLSKAVGAGGGGFLAGTKVVIDWLRFFSRPAMFSVALPPPVVGAAIQAFELIDREPERRVKLQKNIARFRRGLQKIGLESPADSESPVIPVVIGNENLMGRMNEILLENGVFVNCILFPAVPMNSGRFRFSITADHTESEIDLGLTALRKAMFMVGEENFVQEHNDDGPAGASPAWVKKGA